LDLADHQAQGTGGKRFESRNPATRELLATVAKRRGGYQLRQGGMDRDEL